MFCPECRAEYRPGFTHCADCDVDLVHDLPRLNSPVQKSKRDSETYPTNNVSKLLGLLIGIGWIPAGFIGFWIGEKLPRNAQHAFYVFLIVAILLYRFAGAQRLRRKWDLWSNHG
jgi:hypothetical protein